MLTMSFIDTKPIPKITPKSGRSRVNWAITWAAPEIQPSEAKVWDVGIEEAERRLGEIARAAVHHAVVSGEATVTLHVRKARAVKGPR